MHNRVELVNKIAKLESEATELLNANKIAEAEEKVNELEGLKAELNKIDLVNKIDTLNRVPQGGSTMNFLRKTLNATMTEGVPADGGYTVPEDIQTAVNQYKEDHAELRKYVTVEPVKTNKGARTFKKRKTVRTGFLTKEETGKISPANQMQFERVDFNVEDYAGYMPVSNDLLDDSDANIQSLVTNFLGEESIDTDNRLILEILTGLEKKTLNGVDDIKKIFNVNLGQALRQGAVLITNDDGWNYLDSLKDNDGRYLMQPVVTDPTVKKLFGLYEIVVIPNEILGSDVTEAGVRKMPFFCGNLKEAIVIFDRKHYSITVSREASVQGYNAFEQDGLIIKAIMREDVVLRDAKAVVRCEIAVQDATVEGN